MLNMHISQITRAAKTKVAVNTYPLLAVFVVLVLPAAAGLGVVAVVAVVVAAGLAVVVVAAASA